MKLSKLEDHDLVAQYRDGNEQAFEVLIRRHQKRIFLQIYSKVQDSEIADDLFQETFIKIIRSLRKSNYEEKGKFLPGLFVLPTILHWTFSEENLEKKNFALTVNLPCLIPMEKATSRLSKN